MPCRYTTTPWNVGQDTEYPMVRRFGLPSPTLSAFVESLSGRRLAPPEHGQPGRILALGPLESCRDLAKKGAGALPASTCRTRLESTPGWTALTYLEHTRKLAASRPVGGKIVPEPRGQIRDANRVRRVTRWPAAVTL